MPQVTRIKAVLRSPRGRRVAAYARVSGSRDEQLNSLSAQVSYYNDYINKHPEWVHSGIYVDESITGTVSQRPEFQRLLSDCRARKIDMVLTKSISRFSRNTIVLLETIRELKELSIDVYFERENIHSMSGDGELMLSILASFAQAESQSVSDNCKWRIRSDMKKGLTNSGSLRGYKLNNGKLEIVPEEAALVKSIFEDYASGMGTNAIMRKLRKQGIRIARSGLKCLLSNEKYMGDMLLSKSFVKDHITKKQVPNRGELPQYYVTDSHEPIVGREIYQRVQKELSRKAKGSRSDPLATYPFTGLITCGKCGAHYIRKHNAAGTKYEKLIWICSTYNTFGKHECDAKQISESILYEKTAETIGIPKPSETDIKLHIKEIQIPAAGRLVFLFYDGSTRELSWEQPSRRDSWTPEMREAARIKTKERMDRLWPKSK